MNSSFFLKSFRILLFPFALVYWAIISFRNWLFNKNIAKSASFNLPIICVGNLVLGGTGKSPMVEFLVSRLKEKYRVATLSRGYKRKTSGYALANRQSTALEIGDEPMQFHTKFPNIPVAVGEERLVAIPQLLHDHPDLQCIILDDAFQHRQVKAGLNILLTDYSNLYTRDFYFPTGDLRDQKRSSKRAQVIVVTKCPSDLDENEKKEIKREIGPLPAQRVFFAANRYSDPYHLMRKNETIRIRDKTEVLLVTGIANPAPLKELLDEYSHTFEVMHYPDHHIFSIDDWKDIRKRFERMETTDRLILTTEKDATRLVKFGQELENFPIYVIPLAHHFLFGEEDQFVEVSKKFIEGFAREKTSTIKQEYGQKEF